MVTGDDEVPEIVEERLLVAGGAADFVLVLEGAMRFESDVGLQAAEAGVVFAAEVEGVSGSALAEGAPELHNG
jgi:hypothetical protein